MKRTEYIVMSRMGTYVCDFNRVYTDGERFYIRTKEGYQDITGTPAEERKFIGKLK